jgi:hypothetical protein
MDMTLGGGGEDLLEAIEPTADEGFLIGGSSQSPPSGARSCSLRGLHDYWVVKIDANKTIKWDACYGGTDEDFLRSIKETSDGILIGGYSKSGTTGDKTEPSWGGKDYWIVKTDPLGNKLWDHRYGGNSNDLLTTIVPNEHGGFLLGGASVSDLYGDKSMALCMPGKFDFWVIEINDGGGKAWDQQFGGEANDGGSGTDTHFFHTEQTADGGFILAGSNNGLISCEVSEASKGQYDYWVVKIGCSCDDGVYCNGLEICNPVTLGCITETTVSCNDGNPCNGVEHCSSLTDQCEPGTAISCDDGDDCTEEICTPTNYLIVGTGVTTFYNNTGVMTPPLPGAPFFGQDANFPGTVPSYTDNGDGTVTDNITGLMWEQDMGNQITWYEAFTKAESLTTGGYTDWRVPTIKELYSLIQFTGDVQGEVAGAKKFIDEKYFNQPMGVVNTVIGDREIDAQTLSATQYKCLTMGDDTTVFGVNFIDGRIKGYPKYDPSTGDLDLMYFRMVRGNPDYGINNFVNNGDGTVSDLATGLMWQQVDDGTDRIGRLLSNTPKA